MRIAATRWALAEEARQLKCAVIADGITDAFSAPIRCRPVLPVRLKKLRLFRSLLLVAGCGPVSVELTIMSARLHEGCAPGHLFCRACSMFEGCRVSHRH